MKMYLLNIAAVKYAEYLLFPTSKSYFIFSNRHHKLYVSVNDKSRVFKRDASFNVRFGLGASRRRFGISFESVNKPGYFISAVGGSPQIRKKVNSVAFGMAATWMPVTAHVKITRRTKIVTNSKPHAKKPVSKKPTGKKITTNGNF